MKRIPSIKNIYLLLLLLPLIFLACEQKTVVTAPLNLKDYTTVTQVTNGTPVNVKFTSYSTTLIANGRDKARLRITVIDSLGREITSATNEIRMYVKGAGEVTRLDGTSLPTATDTAGLTYGIAHLENGEVVLYYTAGTEPAKVEVEAASAGIWPGSHEIHSIPASVKLMKPTAAQLPATTKPIDKMIGADISFLPQIESRNIQFRENGVVKDAIALLKDHGFNYIRLRIFVNPENPEGYAPETGFCGLDYTLAMAQRIKDTGMKLLLDFHYSDYWADPQKQFKPKAWEGLDFKTLQDTVTRYTAMVLSRLADQGTPADMVQVGNEINHGTIWPEGHIGNLDQLAALLKAGVKGVQQVNKDIPVMMHIALGGQNKESVFWLDNMLARGVTFDVIGLSYYPRWHGTLNDLQANMHDLTDRYNKPVNVVEYSDFKKEVHEIVFNLPNSMGKGAAIWEPLNRRSGLFGENNEATALFQVYNEVRDKYLKK
jgi:beta-galactosidase